MLLSLGLLTSVGADARVFFSNFWFHQGGGGRERIAQWEKTQKTEGSSPVKAQVDNPY